MRCRDVGPVPGQPAFFFGHTAAAPTRRGRERPFDIVRDIRVGNIVAIAISDEDAAEWGRSFDVAFITEVCAPSSGLHGNLRVSFYACRGMVPKDDPSSEAEQLNRVWKREDTVHTVHRDSVLCPLWVDPPLEGLVWEPDKPKLLEALGRLRASGSGSGAA